NPRLAEKNVPAFTNCPSETPKMAAVCSKSWVSVRADSSRAETLEPLKKGCGVWLSKRSARRGRVCQGLAAGLDLLVLGVLARAAACIRLRRYPPISKEQEKKYSCLYL